MKAENITIAIAAFVVGIAVGMALAAVVEVAQLEARIYQHNAPAFLAD